MTTIDPEQERKRLTQFYGEMTDEQLQLVADDGASLTEEARAALTAEITHRALDIKVREPTGSDEMEQRDLVMIRQFRDLPEALLAKGSLESAGIECFLGDDNMVRLDWFISNLIGGAKLLVDRENVEAALAVLDAPIPENFEVEGVGDYQQPKCPRCQSLDANFEPLNKGIAYTSAYVAVPIPLHEKAWVCRSCGHTWQGEADAGD